VPTALSIALQEGLLNDEFPTHKGIRIRALQDADDPLIAQSHFTHSQPNSMRHGSNYPAIWAQASGADTRIIGLSGLRGAQAILSLPYSGIRHPRDLKGKRLLVLRRPNEPIDYVYANTLRFYELALSQVGLDLSDVNLVEKVIKRSFINDRLTQTYTDDNRVKVITGADRPGRWSDSVYSLIRGEVDAITSGGAIGAPTLEYGFLLGLWPVFDLTSLASDIDRANNGSPLVFAVKSDLLEQRPDLIHRILLRVLQAEQRLRQRPSDAVRYVAREQSSAEFLVEQAYGNKLIENLTLCFDLEKIAALKSQVDFLHRHGFIKNKVDVDAWLAPEYLTQARKEFEINSRTI